MKKFSCQCLETQFKSSDQVYVDYDDQCLAEIPCIYRPKESVTLRRIKLKTNYCPLCGAKLEDI